MEVRHNFLKRAAIVAFLLPWATSHTLASTFSASPTMGGDLITTIYDLYLNLRAVAWVVIGLLGVVGFMMWAVNKTIAIGSLVSAVGLGIIGAFIEFTKAATGGG